MLGYCLFTLALFSPLLASPQTTEPPHVIAAGEAHTVALKSDGTVWAWGKNDFGELGDNTDSDRGTPVQVLGPGGIGVFTVHAGTVYDFNGDGKSDILWRHTEGRIGIWLMDGFTHTSWGSITPVADTGWQIMNR
ncbi:MAG: hypothetical protein A3G24_00290 [Betaproteobacteria bacterium RIFCSPLOWO2_12_FULL_62_13]|nr:MAG: hypothetical protein A3G24_00290 [Betaproteobacteria bacterium RIFCSPLOWO2_12_FULL_62_13]